MENIIFTVPICNVITAFYMAIEGSGQSQPLDKDLYWLLHKSKMRYSPDLKGFLGFFVLRKKTHDRISEVFLI